MTGTTQRSALKPFGALAATLLLLGTSCGGGSPSPSPPDSYESDEGTPPPPADDTGRAPDLVDTQPGSVLDAETTRPDSDPPLDAAPDALPDVALDVSDSVPPVGTVSGVDASHDTPSDAYPAETETPDVDLRDVGAFDDGDVPNAVEVARDVSEPDAADSADGGPPACEGIWVERVSGEVFDINGSVPVARLTTLCTSETCIRGQVRDDGSFTYDSPSCFRANGRWERPIVTYHGGGAYADLNVDFIPDGVTFVQEIRLQRPLVTVPIEAMSRVAWDNTSAQALSDPEGFVMSWDAGAAHLPFGVYELAVYRLGPGQLPPVAGVETLSALYAVIPDEAVFAPPATVRFPNPEGFPPGTAIEVLSIGNAATPDVHPGVLGVVAQAHVDASGDRISLDEGEGIVFFGWLGLRPAAR